MTITSSLGPVYAGLALSKSQPSAIVGLGSSTMNGGDQTPENRWYNKYIAHLQALAPSGLPETEVVPLTNATITTPGIHGYNGGQGGTTTRNYFTPERLERIKAIQPVAVLHVIGSNDYAVGISPDEYYNNLIKVIDQIDAVMTRPYTNILVHAHRRAGSFAHQFTEYRSVLQTIGNQRSNVFFVNAEAPFYGAGVPDRDAYNLLGSDNVHLTIAGHDFFYRVVAEATSSLPAIPQVAPSPDDIGPAMVASDSFDVPNYTEVAGRKLDNKLGGYQSKTWTGSSKQLCAYYQRLCRLATATANFFSGIKMDSADQEIAATIFKLPRDAAVYFAVRRQSGDMSTAPNDYRLVVNPTGHMQLVKRVSGATTLLATIPEPVVAQDRVSLRAKGSEITVLVNDAVVASVRDNSVIPAGWAGFSGVGTTHGFELEDIVFSRV